jgi:AraC-like DNA-binding protein
MAKGGQDLSLGGGMSGKVIGAAVTVRFFMPSPRLAPYISTCYLTEASIEPGQWIEDWLHPEWANLRIARNDEWHAAVGPAPLRPVPNLIATGPTSYTGHFTTGPARIWGIGIMPLGWARFFSAPAADFADQICDGGTEPVFAGFAPLLGAIFSDKPDPAAEAARIDAYLLELLDRCPPPVDEARIRAAHRVLIDEDVATVGEFAAKLGVSTRTLERLSHRAFGFPPKLLLRRQRFLRSLAQFMLDPAMTWISTLDSQYVDQAHFVRDFKRFMGMSPSAYAAHDHPVLRAAAQARAAAAGAAVQALHQP